MPCGLRKFTIRQAHQLLYRRSFKVRRLMIHREGNVQVPAAKCTKHLLFRHHAKVDTHLWICALECPKSTGKDLNSGGDR